MKDVDVNVLPALLKRESGYTRSFTERHNSLVSFYGALYPNACAKLRTAEATNIQFSPCGAYVVGINSSGHSIAVWDVDSFLGGLTPPARAATSSTGGSTGGSTVHHNLSNLPQEISRASAPHPTLNAEPETSDIVPSSQGAGLRTGVPFRSTDAVPCADVTGSQKPVLAFSSTLLAHFTPVWKGQKRPLIGHHGHDRGGMRNLAPVEVRDDDSMIEEARSVLCTPAEPLDDAQLQQVWDRRSREQEAMIASWNESRKRLRMSRQSTDTVSTAPSLPTPPTTDSPAPPKQPSVITAPCVRPVIDICGSSSESMPDEIFVEIGSAAISTTVTAGHEKVNDSICLFTQDRGHLLLLAESQSPAGTGGQAAGASAGNCTSSSVIMVSLHSGEVVDRIQFSNERLVMQRNRSCVTWSLHNSTLVILCPRSQQVHIYQVTKDSLMHNRTLGVHLRHDDELTLMNLASAEQQYRSASSQEKCLSAHGDLLPRAEVSVHAAIRRSNSSSTIADRTDTNARRGQAGSRSSNAGSAASATKCYPITGIKQRVAAFVYQKALEGEDLGVGHLFQSPEKAGKAGALDGLVRILHNSDSLVKALVAMSKLPLQRELASKSETQASRVAEAVGRFHRFRSGLEEASIGAVHALDEEHMLMLMQVTSTTKIPLLVLYNWASDRMLFVGNVLSIKVLVCVMWYSHELTHLHDSCTWKSHMPHSLVMQQQLNTLAEQAIGGSRRLPARPTSPRIQSHSHSGAAGGSGGGLSRNQVHRSTSTGSSSQLNKFSSAQNGAAVQSTVDQLNKNLREQVAAVLQNARRVGPERMGQFLLWHLPGASQGSWASPYTNPLLFLPIRKDCIVHFHGSRTLRFSASSTRIEFFPGGHLYHPSTEPVFELDWSMMINDLDPSDASQPKFCDVKFHPFLPLVITCFPSLSCFCVHYRRM